ncbi:copper amine oxidase-like domain-containing protein [Thermodesulfobium narugense DSM 14796]|uniref:Copper amine oxidase-like domain-containing protein n=1 Tax=Thermodesulfobium narugense DSM 14796 TaxID=747365 RepID=M1E591_9BACT|nr:copper amine oxidase-like domain-containing protein [Thermodesulfobium narugense]AEE14907.1 copper amine oxidase-like domain-containing protein [Thermodesulfobium narugense DSM 14796]
MKRIIFIFFALCILFSTAYAQEQTPVSASKILDANIKIANDLKIIVDGKEIKSDVPPVIRYGLIYVPVRFVSEALKATVTWDEQHRTVKVSLGDKSIEFYIESSQVNVNNKEERMLAPAFIYQDRTMVPLEITALNLGASVEKGNNTINIGLNKNLQNQTNTPNNVSLNMPNPPVIEYGIPLLWLIGVLFLFFTIFKEWLKNRSS